MAEPILKPATSLVTAAIDAIVAARPSTLTHFNANGRWADLPALWRAQALLVQKRLASEVNARRLKTAGDESFDALRSLCSSEFDTELPQAPQTALGNIIMTRAYTGTTLPSGIIREGDLFSKQANPNAQPVPIAAASYRAARTIYVPAFSGGGLNVQVVEVPLVATNPGAGANVPTFTSGVATTIQPPATIFDPNLTGACTAAGGSSGITNATLIAAAKAYAIGRFGPTLGAAIAGALRQQSVRHYAIFAGAAGLPYAQLYIADESWAADPTWTSQVLQTLQDATEPFIGFGCRVRTGFVQNQQITIAPTIVLASTDDLTNTDDIDQNVRAVAESYFNDRPDWYIWRAAELQAYLSGADPRILQCTGVTVTDVATGQPITDPTNVYGIAPFQSLMTHYFLTDQNVQSNYLPPS